MTNDTTDEGIQFLNNSELCISTKISRIDYTNFYIQNDLIDTKFKFINTNDKFYIIDILIYQIYKSKLDELLFKKNFILIKGGDKYKNMDTLVDVINAISESKLSRNGTIVGIGGGVITDIAGLASNLYYRSIKCELIPTSLLSMIDASIGGKTGINHPRQKNLIGSFYHPSKVIIDTNFLLTLDSKNFYSAFGEIIKIAIINNSNLFKILEQNTPDSLLKNKDILSKIIKVNITEKLKLLGGNCFERNLDRILNFGHSIAHPLEDLTNFKVSHGYAVGFGIALATHIAYQQRKCTKNVLNRIFHLLIKYNIPLTYNDIDTDKLWEKTQLLVLQRGGDKLRYVIPTDIGNAEIIDNITYKEFNNSLDFIKNFNYQYN